MEKKMLFYKFLLTIPLFLFLFFATKMEVFAAEESSLAGEVSVDIEYIESFVPENYYYLLFEQPMPGSPDGIYRYLLLYSETPISYGSRLYLFCANAGGTGEGFYGCVPFCLEDGSLKQITNASIARHATLPAEGLGFSMLPHTTKFNRIIYSNFNVYYTADIEEVGYCNSSEVFFYPPTATLSSIAHQTVTVQTTLGQMLGILPCSIPLVVGWKAILKGWQFLYSILVMA